MYKIQFQIFRDGYRTIRLEGIYIVGSELQKSVIDMKCEAFNFIRDELIKNDLTFKSARIEMSVFKRIKTDFVLAPKSVSNEWVADSQEELLSD